MPDWSAAMIQVPDARTMTVEPDTVQIDGVVVLNVTGKPELAVAVTANGAGP